MAKVITPAKRKEAIQRVAKVQLLQGGIFPAESPFVSSDSDPVKPFGGEWYRNFAENEMYLLFTHTDRRYNGGVVAFERALKSLLVHAPDTNIVHLFGLQEFGNPYQFTYRGRTIRRDREVRLSTLELAVLKGHGSVTYCDPRQGLEVRGYRIITRNYRDSESDYARNMVLERDLKFVRGRDGTERLRSFTLMPSDLTENRGVFVNPTEAEKRRRKIRVRDITQKVQVGQSSLFDEETQELVREFTDERDLGPEGKPKDVLERLRMAKNQLRLLFK
jgi:hypothetical protein